MVLIHNQVVEAPSLFSPKHNLMDSALRTGVSQDRWENGAVFNPQGCYEAFTQEANCPPEDKDDTFQECPDPVIFQPFVVEFGVQYLAHENNGELEKELDAKTSAAVERAIWAGTLAGPTNPKLSDGTPAVGTVTNGRQLVGILESTLYENGMQGGTIHISPYDAAQAEGVFEEKDGKLYTTTQGNPVIIGNYPMGTAAIHGGEVDVYASDEWEAISYEELRMNRLLYKVERLVLVVWNPCFVFKATVAP